MTIRPQPVKFEKAPPLHLFFQFEENLVEKITLEEGESFQLFFSGTSSKENKIIQWITQFLQGVITPFPQVLKRNFSPFTSKVLGELEKIPIGDTKSYKEIATQIGNPLAARAIGNVCNKNPFPFIIPCHRVIKNGGKLGGFAYGAKIKKRLLDFEKNLIQLKEIL